MRRWPCFALANVPGSARTRGGAGRFWLPAAVVPSGRLRDHARVVPWPAWPAPSRPGRPRPTRGGRMPRPPRLTVLGSLNMDISVAVAVIAPGGKGANQAVAAARLAAAVTMAGCTGDDDFGRTARGALAAEGVDVGGGRTVPGSATGLALITVDDTGENVITVAPGANARVGEAEIGAALSAGGDMVVL